MIRYTETRVPKGWGLSDTLEGRHAFNPLQRNGPWVTHLEDHFASTHQRYALAVNSGSTGLLMALLATPGDWVTAQNNTFIAERNAITLAGKAAEFHSGKPVMNPSSISPDTHIAMIASIGGQISMTDEKLWRDALIANPHLTLIHDASHSPFHVHPDAAIGVISLDYAKPITGGEGGMLIVKDHVVYERLKAIRDNGRVGGMVGELTGINGHMNEMSACLACWSFTDYSNARVREIRKYYDERLKVEGAGGDYIYFYPAKDQDKAWTMRGALSDAEIQSPVMYQGISRWEKNDWSQRHVVLPLHRYLTDAEVERVIDVVKGVGEK